MFWATLLSLGKSALGFLAKIPWKVWLFLGLILAAYLYGEARYSAGKAHVQADWDESTATAKAAKEAREKEWGEAVYRIAYDWETWRIGYEADTKRVVDDLRSGAIRVRPRLQCGVSQASASASVHDGSAPGAEQPGGFSQQDAEFLLHVGADADAVGARLTACQDYVRTITKESP